MAGNHSNGRDVEKVRKEFNRERKNRHFEFDVFSVWRCRLWFNWNFQLWKSCASKRIKSLDCTLQRNNKERKKKKTQHMYLNSQNTHFIRLKIEWRAYFMKLNTFHSIKWLNYAIPRWCLANQWHTFNGWWWWLKIGF